MTEQQTVSAAVAERKAPLTDLLESYTGEFGKLLPAQVGPERFTRWSLSLLRKSVAARGTEADLKQAERWRAILSDQQVGVPSVMHALLDAASLGLEPGREYWLLPFGREVTGMVGYQGDIRLITNAERCTVVAQLVREGDDFHMTGANIPPRHDAEWFAAARSSLPVAGGYAYVDYGGQRYSLVCRMSEEEFLKHRDKAKTKSIWDEWPEAMRLKTLTHEVRKRVPWSAEWRPS